MKLSDLDVLMSTMIACIDELDPVVTGGRREAGNQAGLSPVSDEEILCHWMIDLWSQIDCMVVDETYQQQIAADNVRSSRGSAAPAVANLPIEMGLPDLATMAALGTGSRLSRESRSPRPQFSWCLFPGAYNGVMDMLSRRC